TRSPLLIPAAVLAVGIALAALIFGAFFYNARTTDATIQVVGSASQRFTSDTAKWRLTLSRRVGLTNLSAGYNQLNRDLRIVLDRLQEAGIDSSAVTIQQIGRASCRERALCNLRAQSLTPEEERINRREI